MWDREEGLTICAATADNIRIALCFHTLMNRPAFFPPSEICPLAATITILCKESDSPLNMNATGQIKMLILLAAKL